MYNQDYKLVRIAEELGIHTSTLRRWLRKEGIEPKNDSYGSNPKKKEEDNTPDPDPLKTALDENLEDKTDEAISIAKHEARLAEDKSLMEIAESQSSPAEKYQSYIAAAGIKLLRDSMKNLRGPKSVRELSELDQLIRRNMGLNAKSGGGAGKMQIDISILNNARADKGKGSIQVKPNKIIDVEPEKEDGENA
jgi:transposase-like protein